MPPFPASGSATRPARAPGATLVELVVMLAVGAVLAALAVPAYRDWIADTRLRTQAEALAATLTRARSAAIRSGGRVTVCKSADRQTCAHAGGWDQGWLLFVDDDRDGSRDAAEPMLYVEAPAPRPVTITANHPLADYVSYTSIGHPRLVNGGLQMGTFVACSPGRQAIKVVLAASGRVRLEKPGATCP
jgi:type IV fimbrial biogenesis protein FimT